MDTDNTIAAISTPPGRSGIGIVRLSGPHALQIAERLLALGGRPLEPSRSRYTRVVDPEDAGRTLDEAMVTAFHAPHSYTGEHVVEIATHGSPLVLRAVLSAACAAGARPAEPGEFTERAFRNGRMDLTQAEAVHDLIAARTLDAVRLAVQQLGGALSRRLAAPKERLLHLIALLEAGMDFASGELDDVDVVAPEYIAVEIARVEEELRALAATYRRGHLLHAGAALALVGRPNAGKSSLFNRLLERERAIVTAVPGTTRDTVEESLALEGIPLRLIDTAGLRGLAEVEETAADEAELMGIARSREALADADIVLVIHDATEAMTAGELALVAELQGRPHLVVMNKVDLLAERDAANAQEISTSAVTGEGIAELRAAILAALHAGECVSESAALTNPRQLQAMEHALGALAAAHEANRVGLPHEALLVDLHTARGAMDSLTGQTTTDDILARIFSTFCIGK